MSADTEIKGSICVLTFVNWEGRGEMYRVRYLGVMVVEMNVLFVCLSSVMSVWGLLNGRREAIMCVS